LDIIYNCGILGLACHMVVHRYEETIEFKELLDEKMFGFPLPYHFKNYVTRLFQCFNDKMFSYYKSLNICKEKGFSMI
jgi:hypothetical protein